MKKERFADLIKGFVSSYEEIYPLGRSNSQEEFKNRAALYSAINISLDMSAKTIGDHLKRDRSSIHRAIKLHKDNMMYLQGYRDAYRVATQMIAYKVSLVAVLEETKETLRDITEVKNKIEANLKEIEQAWK